MKCQRYAYSGRCGVLGAGWLGAGWLLVCGLGRQRRDGILRSQPQQCCGDLLRGSSRGEFCPVSFSRHLPATITPNFLSSVVSTHNQAVIHPIDSINSTRYSCFSLGHCHHNQSAVAQTNLISTHSLVKYVTHPSTSDSPICQLTFARHNKLHSCNSMSSRLATNMCL